MKYLIIFIFSINAICINAQDCIYKIEPESSRVAETFLDIPIDSVQTIFFNDLEFKYKTLLETENGSFFMYAIYMDSLGCITKVLCFGSNSKNEILKEYFIDNIKLYHACRILSYQDTDNLTKARTSVYMHVIVNKQSIQISFY